MISSSTESKAFNGTCQRCSKKSDHFYILNLEKFIVICADCWNVWQSFENIHDSAQNNTVYVMSLANKEEVKPKEEVVANPDCISYERYNDLLIELEGYPEIAKSLLSTYNLQTLADLPRSEYTKVRSKITHIKRENEQYEARKK